MIINFEW